MTLDKVLSFIHIHLKVFESSLHSPYRFFVIFMTYIAISLFVACFTDRIAGRFNLKGMKRNPVFGVRHRYLMAGYTGTFLLMARFTITPVLLSFVSMNERPSFRVRNIGCMTFIAIFFFMAKPASIETFCAVQLRPIIGMGYAPIACRQDAELYLAQMAFGTAGRCFFIIMAPAALLHDRSLRSLFVMCRVYVALRAGNLLLGYFLVTDLYSFIF
jgi:hypothetical protein